MNLGQLIKQLESYPSDDNCIFVGPKPMSVGRAISYRGFYDQLALEPSDDRKTVGDTLAILRAAVGATMTGYKGGDFLMTEHTPVWAAEYSMSGGMIVSGVQQVGYSVVIMLTPSEYT